MKEKILSIFIDESGDFGQYNPASPNYYVAQAADSICTVEAIAQKNVLTKSESEFFHSKNDFKKILIKILQRRNYSIFPCYLLVRENIREKLDSTWKTCIGKPANTGKPRKYSRNYEFCACCLNVRHSVKMIEENADIRHLEKDNGLKIIGAMYHLDTGIVDFFED